MLYLRIFALEWYVFTMINLVVVEQFMSKVG